MKKLSENIKYCITSGIALLCSILTFGFLFLPAYFEDNQQDLSLANIAFGTDRVKTNGVLIFAFVLMILGVIGLGYLIYLHAKKSGKDKIITITAIVSAILILVSGIILSLSIFVSGLEKLNSELGFLQGSWGIKIGNILVPIFTLLSVGFTYPSCMIILHHKDLEDKK